MAIELDLQTATTDPGLPSIDAFESWVSAALDTRQAVHLTIRLVDEEESRTLNQTYRGKDNPTNVLSFMADLPPEVDLPLLGDIVICAPVVRQEAEDQGKDLRLHWAHLVVHGTLHLLGMDHQQPDQARAMERREVEILERLGIANPYE